MEICMQETYQFDICKGSGRRKQWGNGEFEATKNLQMKPQPVLQRIALELPCRAILRSKPKEAATLHWVLDTCSSWGGQTLGEVIPFG